MIVRVLCSGFSALVLIDGCAAFEAWDSAGRVAEYELTPWLRAGWTDLEVLLGPGLPEGQERAFDFMIYRSEWDRKHDEPLLRYRWTEVESVLGPKGLTPVLEHRFRIGDRPPRWAWESAQAYQPEADRADVLAVVDGLHERLQAKKRDEVCSLLHIKTTELAHGLGSEVEQQEAVLRTMLEVCFAADRWQLAPLEDLELRTAAAGRLVHVCRAGGGPAISGFADEMPFGMSLTLSHLEEHWSVVR